MNSSFGQRQAIRALAVAGLVLGAALAYAGGAQAWTLKTLYSFCRETDCTDGFGPQTQVSLDASGNLFGTAANVVYELKLDARTGKWKETAIYHFCSEANCADGSLPLGALVIDADENLFGTATSGGAAYAGVFFELAKAHGSNWEYRKLYDFCSLANCADGENPKGGLTYQGAELAQTYDGHSPLYGTADGGAICCGLVFQFEPSGSAWSEQPLYNFCSQADCVDGSGPSGLIIDPAGNFYGSTGGGGAFNSGAVFELSPGSPFYAETLLYNFCPRTSCKDGHHPSSPLVVDSSGDFFGTTYTGGKNNDGTLYEIMPNGGNPHEVVLHSFCSMKRCKDGINPETTLTIDGAGRVYGTTADGGSHAKGVAFLWDGTDFTPIYSFCRKANCNDGSGPFAGLTADGAGNLYGTTRYGGKFGEGTVFELSP